MDICNDKLDDFVLSEKKTAGGGIICLVDDSLVPSTYPSIHQSTNHTKPTRFDSIRSDLLLAPLPSSLFTSLSHRQTGFYIHRNVHTNPLFFTYSGIIVIIVISSSSPVTTKAPLGAFSIRHPVYQPPRASATEHACFSSFLPFQGARCGGHFSGRWGRCMVSSSAAVPIFLFGWFGVLVSLLLFTIPSDFCFYNSRGGGGAWRLLFSLSLYCNEGSGSRVPMVGGEGGGVWR